MLITVLSYLAGLATIPAFFALLFIPDFIRDAKYHKRYAKTYYRCVDDWNDNWTAGEQRWFLQHHPKDEYVQRSNEDHYFRIRFDELENIRQRRVEASYWPWLAELLYG